MIRSRYGNRDRNFAHVFGAFSSSNLALKRYGPAMMSIRVMACPLGQTRNALASKPNGTFATASRLVVNSYLIDQVTTTDPIATFVVQIPKAATYTFETSGVLGTCGLALELDTSIELYDSTQTLKAKNDNTPLPTSALCSQIATALTPGTYYIRVFQSTAAAAGSLGGQFRIAVRDTP